jgi:HK97 family phage prohead protease/HK97 family phage major capsid protein
MLTKEKVLKLCVPLESMKDSGDDGGLQITGHASTNDEDRSGDIIVSDAWKKSEALANYLKNPVILAFHDMTKPIGKTIAHEVDENGLKITAKISKAAGSIVDLIKEGILSALSVGFMIKDADLDTKSGTFVIKELELYEISVVSVPANQNALFSIAKNFSDPEEYTEFKKQFINKSQSEETLMDDEKNTGDTLDIAALTSEITAQVKSTLATEKAEAEAAKAKEDAEVAKIESTATSAVERLAKDIKTKVEEDRQSIAEALEAVKEALSQGAEKEELKKAFSEPVPNKMKFLEENKNTPFAELTTDQKDGMIYASRVFGCRIEDTKTFKDYAKKSNMEHWDSGVTGEWESEYSTRVQNAMREELVVEPLFTTLPMSTPTLNMPINPEAGDATWVHSGAYRSSQNPADETGDGTDTSTGEAQNHQLDEQTIVAHKLATREYIGYEEEEDSIVTLAPIIRDAVTRRMVRAADLAFLRGGGVLTSASFDPILGLEGRGASTTDVTVAGGAGWRANYDVNDIADMRRNLGLYGLDPSQLVLLTSHDLYYEMMKDADFKTIDTYGTAATLFTGEVGRIYGMRVLVSQMFNNAAITTGTVGTTLAILARPSNFIKGELRGVMTEADRDIINQKRVIVSSRRFGFQDIITGEATVNYQIAS